MGKDLIEERMKALKNTYKEKFSSKYMDDYNKNPIAASYKMSSILEMEIPAFVRGKENKVDKLSELVDGFISEEIPKIENIVKSQIKEKNNVYNMAKSDLLVSANAVTRSLNTRLGYLWEKIANLSSYVISPELEFGVKLKGIDVIIFDEKNSKFIYVQMKTQKNTLTGSQSDRVTKELKKYNKSWLVACIDNDAKWTYKGNIKTKVGDEFWKFCGIDYSAVMNSLMRIVKSAEKCVLTKK